jgi:hypothetical protein
MWQCVKQFSKLVPHYKYFAAGANMIPQSKIVLLLNNETILLNKNMMSLYKFEKNYLRLNSEERATNWTTYDPLSF